MTSREAFGIVYKNDINTVASLEIDAQVRKYEHMMDSAKHRLRKDADSIAKLIGSIDDLERGPYSRDELTDQESIVSRAGGIAALRNASEEQRKAMVMEGIPAALNRSNLMFNNMSVFSEKDIAAMVKDPAYAKAMVQKLQAMSPAELEKLVKARTPQAKAHAQDAEGDYRGFEGLMQFTYTNSRVMYFHQELAAAVSGMYKGIEEFHARKITLGMQKGSHDEIKREAEEQLGLLSHYDARLQQEARTRFLQRHVDRSDEELAYLEEKRMMLLRHFMGLLDVYDRSVYYFREEGPLMQEKDRLALLYQFLQTETSLVDMAGSLLKIYREETYSAALWYHDLFILKQ